MTINFNVSPYYDDYDETKGFYRILFKPGVAVQARELTQLQTILQKQVERFGKHVFKDGSMVIPGQTSVDTTVGYVKLQSGYTGSLSSYLGQTFESPSSGLTAKVIHYEEAEGADPATLFVKYINSGTSGNAKVFDNNTAITNGDATLSALTALTNATGNGSIASIEAGVYFLKNAFVLVGNSTITLDKYSNTPTYRIGLAVDEDILTEEDDETLNDNATGSPNYAAPGAHRYKISTRLVKLALDSTLDEDFVELVRINNGVIQRQVRESEYSVLEQNLARRTFDESGNYTVRPFQIQVREHRNNYRGDRSSVSGDNPLSNVKTGDVVLVNGNYYVSPSDTSSIISTAVITAWGSTPKPKFNNGVYTDEQGGNTSKLAIGLEPGKAYVQGFEVQKIGTEYLAVDKPRQYLTVANTEIQTAVGNYVKVSNLYVQAETANSILNFANVTLYDRFTSPRGTNTGNVIGTARVRMLTPDSGNADLASAVFKLSLFDISLNNGTNFNRNVKSIGGTNLKADIDPVLIPLAGTVTAAASTTLVGSGTNFNQLVVGDYISMANPTVTVRRVTAIANAQYLTLDQAATVTNSTISRVETELKDVDRTALIYPLAYPYVRDMSAVSYTQYRRYSGTASGGTLTISTEADYTFDTSALTSDVVVINTTSGNLTDKPESITFPAPNQMTLTGLANATFEIIAPVRKVVPTKKTKTLQSASEDFTNVSQYGAKEITLTYADVIEVSNILMANATGSFSSTDTTNITDWFTLDNGQRSTHYAQGRLIKNPIYPAVTNSIRVNYKYYAHTDGQYFDASSYPGRYEDISTFNGIRLSDVIDFRPRIDASGASTSTIPALGFRTTFSFSYYLARKDKIAIDINGNFFNIQGVDALIPPEPNDPEVGMVLYKVDLAPYTISTDPKFVTPYYVDNKRYTMRDIGRLEKRIENIEYYTALSLLEQETKSLTILDDNNLDRYKNGFIVDNFEGHGVGDTQFNGYLCSVDVENKELRPFCILNNVDLLQKTLSGTVKTGDVITLPYTNTTLVSQTLASRTENVNPFAIAAFNGTITLTPSSDDWFETQRRPDIIINEEGNFDTIRTLAESSGVLGTVWNAWQTQWTGAPVVTDVRTQTGVLQSGTGLDFDQRFGVGSRRDTAAFSTNIGVRTVTTATQASQSGLARTGVRTTVVARTDQRVISDRQLSLATIPFIRSRTITFLARGLKPSTVFYPYFDDQSISSYVKPATQVSLSGITGEFDYKTNIELVESTVERDPRRIAGNPNSGFNRGDVVYVSKANSTSSVIQIQNSPATGVVAFYEVKDSGNVLHIVNVKGNFYNGNVITGTVSGASATVSGTPTSQSLGGQLKTNSAGDVAGEFAIPNTDSIKFRTGIREFKLTDSATNSLNFTSLGRTQYAAQGLLETRQSTVAAVRNAEFVRESVFESTTVLNSSERVIGDTGWYDPLAQTFLVQQKGGAFLTKVDIFFSAVDTVLPVTLEIREVVNGYPGKRVLPFSRTVLSASEVVASEDATKATTFTFRSPVYVQENQEYCIVLLTDSTNYRAWISQIGDTAVGSDRIISQQPYAGVLFKSQNASTWTADQLQDLKFNLYRASFTTNAVGTVTFENEKIPTETLQNNPFQLTQNSSVVRVLHPNHGMQSGTPVTISGVTANAFGIYAANLNATHTISNVLIDSYTITLGSSAANTTLFGGSSVIATRNFAYNVLQPSIQYQNFSDTDVTFIAKTTSGQSPSGSEVANVFDTTGVDVIANDNNIMNSVKMITVDAVRAPSLQIIGSLSSTNDALSPVIDLNRTSAIVVNNRIDNPSSTYNNDIDKRTVISANTLITLTGNTINTSNGSVANALATISVGKLLTVSSNATPANNVTYTVTNVTKSGAVANISLNGSFTAESGNAITLVVGENLVSEISPTLGTTASKYITKQVNLNYPSTFLKIIFASSVPTGAAIDVYYKTLPSTSSSSDAINFVQATPASTFPTSDDPNLFKDVEYEIANLPAFSAVVVKLVFRSNNSSAVPKVKDLRIIACA